MAKNVLIGLGLSPMQY